ncbi:MAG TPA: serine/threonine-protein kinase [Gemmataceae bacterium]|jgi:serine/threonine protein kinase/tetratricopeptide (TPR) repeat protein|nr:serine/threonine-protein kinase [Gemmataceae bacterium]
MPANPELEERIFTEALEKRSPEECAAYLDSACRNDACLRGRVENLLRSHRGAPRFLHAPPMALAPASMIAEGPGTVIDRYKLLEKIGEGGFGTVFLAEQTDPVRRLVAIKVLKPGMGSHQVIARFEAERQALALMEHPNIARVLDGGQTASGRPHFVMELVRGLPITDYCDHNELPLQRRLELFVTVCQAIQHAHHKGIIHRDIKPTNVLVTFYDGVPVAKVIDFGIAKAIGQRLTDKTLWTGIAQMIGTPMYMSPEQAEMSGLDIDTRTDIYSLGVLLYELMTGTTPFDEERVKQASYDELRRMIREEEPPRPSTRLSTLGLAATTLATRRHSDPKRLFLLVRGELDWIVMKALEKDRTRRYITASALAADVQHYLADEPVTAGPPSTWYRFRKLARRRRAALLMAGVVSVALVLVIAASAGSIGWALSDRATREASLDGEVERILDEAMPPIEKGNWSDAGTVLTRAQKLLAAAGRQQIPPRLQALQKDLAMGLRLEQITARATYDKEDRLLVGNRGIWLQDAVNREFTQAFKDYEIDLTAESVHRAAEQIRSRTIQRELTRTLDFWCGIVRAGNVDVVPDWQHLLLTAKESDPDPWRNRVREALTNLDPKTLEDLAASVDLRRESPATQLLLATALQEVGSLEQALAVLRKAQEQYPGDLAINDSLGWLYYLSKPTNHQEAIRFLTAALAIDPSRWQTWRKRAIVFSASMQEESAIADYSQAIRWNSQDAALWLERSTSFSRLKLSNQAIADLNRSIELDPTLWGAYHNRGCAFQDLQQPEQALADYSRAIEIEPRARLPREHRCRLNILLEQWDKAADDYSRLVEMPPQETFDFAAFAIYRLQAGNVKGYREACDRMVGHIAQIKGDPRMAYSCALACSLIPGAVSDSSFPLKMAEMSLARPMTRDYFWRNIAKGAGWYRAGRIAQAVRQFEAILTSWPADQLTSETADFGPLVCWLFLAQANQSLNRTEESKRWLEKAVRRMEVEEGLTTKMHLRGHRPFWAMCLVLRREAQRKLNGEEAKE